MSKKVIEVSFYLALIGGVSVLLFFIFQPFLTALFLAMVFAIIFQPVFEKLTVAMKGRDNIAAFGTVTIVLVAILLPLFILGALLFQEAKDVTVGLTENGGVMQFIDGRLAAMEGYLHSVAPDIEINLNSEQYVQGLVGWITSNFDRVFSGVAQGTISFFLMIIALFFFLRDGEKLKQTVVRWSPLSDDNDEGILERMSIAVDSVIKGSLLIAVIQGFLAGLGFAVFGAPSPVLWGFVATITAFIPSVGTAIVIFPMVALLYFTGEPVSALGLLLWGVFIVGLIDNVLRPILIERGIKIHPFLILLSVFGGISFFGPIGFLAGPIILSFIFALIAVYPDVMRKNLCEKLERKEIEIE